MKKTMKKFIIQHVGNKTIPPTEMVADQDHRHSRIFKVAMEAHFTKMPPDHDP
jgi:hypothetical protein